jgi:hypothetical protein
MKFKIFTIVLLFISSFALTSNAQWTANTAVNNDICTASGDQATPKIAATSDGGCYIMWFDNRVPNYKVYLQKMDPSGNPLFGTNGLLISSNPQNSSLQDFNIDVDANDNAVLVFTDTRNTVLNPFAYLISPSGVSLWGPNGISLTDSTNISQNIPVVSATSDGYYVFAWTYGSGPVRIATQKLDVNGNKVWGTNPIKYRGTGTENFSNMRLIKSDAGSVIMDWQAYTGNITTTSTIKIFIQKISSAGTAQWTSPQDTVQNLGRVAGISFIPYLVSDGQNGAVICWVDDRDANARQSVWTQRYNSAGAIQFPKNGSEGTILSTNNHFSPSVTYSAQTSETFLFWTETNGGQTLVGGFYGQKFDAAGTRQWGDNGKEFKTLDNNQLSFIAAYTRDTNVVVSYTETFFGGSNANVKIMRTGPSSEFHWTGNILTASSFASTKIRKQAVMEKLSGSTVMTWSDGRSGTGDIYAQMIKLNGEAGVCSINAKVAIEGFWNTPAQVSDTVRFYLRNSSSPYAIVDSGKVYLNTNGEGTVSFANAPSGTYYLSLIHRNSIETWSSSSMLISKGSNSYDFTTAATQAYGSNMILKDGRYCIFSGDINQDGTVDGSDLSVDDNAALISLSGYVVEDVTGDNFVDSGDLSIVDNNATGGVTAVTP